MNKKIKILILLLVGIGGIIIVHFLLTDNYFGQGFLRISRDPCSSFDTSKIILKHNYFPVNTVKPPENVIKLVSNPGMESNAWFYDDRYLKYYFQGNLFESNRVKNKYICKTVLLNKKSYDFTVKTLGFSPPYTELIMKSMLEPNGGYAYAVSNLIINLWQQPITMDMANNLSFGFTHEFIHSFLLETNVFRKNWFDEGLADFVEHFEQHGPNVAPNTSGLSSSGVYCRDTGWEFGQYDDKNNFTSSTGLIPYSDFTVGADYNSPFLNPLNPSSYYNSGECFWGYIEENYGLNKIKEITQAWNLYRDMNSPQVYLISDIINPILKQDLSNLVLTRYNYTEPYRIKEVRSY